MSNPFEDRFRSEDIIIPPRSIVNGTAPMGVFLEYVGSIDLSKVRVCDAISISYWLNRYMDAMPEAIRKQYEEALRKGTELA